MLYKNRIVPVKGALRSHLKVRKQDSSSIKAEILQVTVQITRAPYSSVRCKRLNSRSWMKALKICSIQVKRD